ncbi:unnamed protein product, partial [Candidula unifasciata]
IEATDLASLLCRFEQAKCTSSTYFEPPCHLVESPSAPVLVKSEITTEPSVTLKEMSSIFIGKAAESRNMPVSGHSDISSIADTLDSFLAQSQFMFQDVVSLPDFSSNGDMLDTFSSPIKNEFTDEFLEIFASDDLSTNNTLYSAVAMSDMNDSHSNCSSLSSLLHQNSIFSGSSNDGEICLNDMVDIKNGISDIILESSFSNLQCDQPSLEHVVTSDSQLWEIFMGLDHSYCSRPLPEADCTKDASGCLAVFGDYPENSCYDQTLLECVTNVLDDSCSVPGLANAEMFSIEEEEIVIDAKEEEIIIDAKEEEINIDAEEKNIFFDTKEEEIIFGAKEEKIIFGAKEEEIIFGAKEEKIVIDTDSNGMYCNPSGQLPGCESFDKHLSSLEDVQTAEENIPVKLNNSVNSSVDNMELNTDPSSEDAEVFFDKIPAYYTALSISSKPLTTSVFASSTKNIGSTDHLDMWDSKEKCDDRHYDKVPPIRRCFANTVKEVEIKPGSSDNVNVATAPEPEKDVLPNSSAQKTVIVPLTVENVAATADLKHPKRSHSPYTKTASRCSRSPVKRSPSTSRFSRHSASSSSDCSTCSSCSRCSTCSLSRSCSSSGSERDSSLCSDYRRSNGHSPKIRHPFITHNCFQQWLPKMIFRHKYKAKHDSAMDMRTLQKRKLKEEEQTKAMEERRIVYVGKIPDGYTKKQLYQRFQSFGEIKEVKVNFREHGDNYGFVTFAYSCDAVAAKEKGNSKPGEARFDLCFGGRRHFCPDQYADLDGNREIEEEYASIPGNGSQGLDFAALLKLHSSQQRKK